MHISYADGDIFNENLEDISLKVIDGTVTVRKEWNCKTDGHKYGTIPQKIEGSEVIPAKNECLKQGSYKTAIFCEKCREYNPETVQTVYIGAKGHDPAEAVKENEILGY